MQFGNFYQHTNARTHTHTHTHTIGPTAPTTAIRTNLLILTEVPVDKIHD